MLGNEEQSVFDPKEKFKIDKEARELLELLNSLDENTRRELSRDILTFSKGYIQAEMNQKKKNY